MHLQTILGDVGIREDLKIGVHPLHDFVDAGNRKPTQNFLVWFRHLEGILRARTVSEGNCREWSHLYIYVGVSISMEWCTMNLIACVCMKIMDTKPNYCMVFINSVV